MTALALLLLTACQSQPEAIIDETTMTALLTDVHMSEGLIDLQSKQTRNDPEYGQRVMAAVLMKYNVSKADYDSSLVWYSQHLNSLIRIYKHVNANLQEAEEQWSELAAASNAFGTFASGDSVELWQQNTYAVLDEHRLTHLRIWTLDVDTTFHPGDTLLWRLHVPTLPEGEGLVASMTMTGSESKMSNLRVAGGTTSGWLTTDTLLTLQCVADSGQTFQQVVATLHLLPADTTVLPLRPCVVDSLSLVRKHRKL